MNLKGQLVKLSVIAIQLVKLIPLFFFIAVNLSANAQRLTETWITKSIDKKTLVKVESSTLEEGFLKKIRRDYAICPLYPDRKELENPAIFRDKVDGGLVVFFDVSYVEDIQIVYKTDREGVILDKYIYSLWGTKN